MRTLLKLCVFITALTLIAISCQKDLRYEYTNSDKTFTPADAREWYYRSFVKSPEFASNNQKKNGIKQPDWQNGKYRKVGDIEIVEFPLIKEKTSIPIESSIKSADKNKIAEASLTRISFIKTGDNEIVIRELDYIPQWDYLKIKNFDINDVELGKMSNKFTGRIITKKWNGEILSTRLLKDGKIIGKAVRKKEKFGTVKSNKNDTPTSNYQECVNIEVCVVSETCHMYPEGDVYYPGAPCVQWIQTEECFEEQVCTEVEDEEEEEEGCDYGSTQSCECQLYGIGCTGGGGGGTGGGGPQPYQLSANDIRVISQLDAEDAASNNISMNLDCQGTKTLGNIYFQGTKEHWLIQLDYVAKNPIYGEREYAIPQSSAAGGRGRADIVNTLTKEIFEIKPNNPQGITNGTAEVTNYVTKANIFCPTIPPGMWKPGINYTTTLIPSTNPTQYLEATKVAPGVIGYQYIPRANNPTPLPVVIPTTVIDKLKDLVNRLKNNLADADRVIAEFMADPANSGVVSFIKGAAIGAAVVIVVGTIVEDIATAGVGIVDDWASFTLAYRIVRFAWAL